MPRRAIALLLACALTAAAAEAKRIEEWSEDSTLEDDWLDALPKRWDYAPLLAEEPSSCAGFKRLLARGLYPSYATGQSGLCGLDATGAFYYGFAVAKSGGVLEVGVVAPSGDVCVGTGYRAARGAGGTAPWVGAVAMVCSDRRVATGEFHQGETFISDGRGRFLEGVSFTFTSFGISGAVPSRVLPPAKAAD